MIKPGYSLVVVAPPRGILTNQGLVAPSRGGGGGGLRIIRAWWNPLPPTPAPIYPFYAPYTPTPQSLENGGPPYKLVLN